LLARRDLCPPLRWCGQNSLIIYLAFFLPMAITRVVLLKTGIVPDIGLVSLIDTVAGVTGALLMWWGAKRAGLNFLFERPALFWIAPKQKRPALQAAE
jgi:uncharacterized membrane protein YcfT